MRDHASGPHFRDIWLRHEYELAEVGPECEQCLPVDTEKRRARRAARGPVDVDRRGYDLGRGGGLTAAPAEGPGWTAAPAHDVRFGTKSEKRAEYREVKPYGRSGWGSVTALFEIRLIKRDGGESARGDGCCAPSAEEQPVRSIRAAPWEDPQREALEPPRRTSLVKVLAWNIRHCGSPTQASASPTVEVQ